MSFIVIGPTGTEASDANLNTAVSLSAVGDVGVRGVIVSNYSNSAINVDMTLSRSGGGTLNTSDRFFHPENSDQLPNEVHRLNTSRIRFENNAVNGPRVFIDKLAPFSNVIVPYEAVSTDLEIDNDAASTNVATPHGTSAHTNDRVYFARVGI